MSFLSSQEARLGLALAIGLLIGTERERRHAERARRGPAGMRSFGLVGFLGGLFGYLGSMPLVTTGAAIVGLSSIAAYVMNRDDPDRGMTTELSLVVTYGLGVLALSNPTLSAGGAAVVASLLAFRGGLHKFAQEILSQEELHDSLVFLLFALVVLPIAPDAQAGPYGAINPQSLTRLVVVLMFLTGVAHIAQRLVGARLGLTLTGFVGGFVSSSATIALLGSWAKEHPTAWRSAVSGALASSVATIVQYFVIISVVDSRLLQVLLPSLGSAAVVAVLLTAAFTWWQEPGDALPEKSGRAFRLWAALGFALVFSLVSIASAALRERMGSAGILLVSTLAALVDAHSTAGSVAAQYRDARLDAHTVQLAIIAALSANTLTKVVLAWTGRQVKYGLCVTASVLLIAAAAWLGLMVVGPL